MRRLILLLLTLLVPAAGQAQPAAPIRLAEAALPHRAVYDIALAPARDGSERTRIESARGRLVYEFTGSACEGWTTTMRFVTELSTGEAQTQVSDIRSTSVESADGAEYRFVTRSLLNDRLREQADGVARRQGERITVTLRQPAARSLDLPAATLFPTQHMFRVLEAARAGERFVAVDIFDGGEGGTKVYGSTAIVGRPEAQAVAGHPTARPELAGAARWPISIAFFDKERATGEQTPAYTLRAEIYEAGITHGLTIDYGSFALEGRMTALDLLPRGTCP